MYSSLFVVLMGLGVVFFGLVCIILLTSLMGTLLKSASKPAASASAAAAPAAAPVAAKAPVVNAAKQEELVAVITAALYQELGSAARGLEIRSIREI